MGYGTEKNDIDIQTLLQDLGYWDAKPPKQSRSNFDFNENDDDLDEGLPPEFRDPRFQSPPKQKPANTSPKKKKNNLQYVDEDDNEDEEDLTLNVSTN